MANKVLVGPGLKSSGIMMQSVYVKEKANLIREGNKIREGKETFMLKSNLSFDSLS